MRFNFLIFVIFICALPTLAQQPQNQRQRAVINEDGGRSYLIMPGTTQLTVPATSGAAITDLQQYSIFLGSAWTTPALRAREARLSKLLANLRDRSQINEITAAGITNFYAPTWSMEKPDITGNRTISDLQIQTILTEVMKYGPRPDPDSIVIVYLDPTLRSRLGTLAADKHYLAYHGFLNSSGARIHYAVVPFQSDAQAAYQIGLRTLIVAALSAANATQ